MPSREDVRRSIVEIVANIAEVPADAVSPDAQLADLDVDSLRGLRIVAEVERKWGIVISEEEIGKIRSMSDIFGLVENRAS